MKKIILVTIIGIICLAGCTLSGLDLTLTDPSIKEVPAEVPAE